MPDIDNTDVRIAHMLKRRADLTPAAFHRAWLGVNLAALAELPGLRRYAQDHTLPQGYAKGDLLFDGCEEFVFGPTPMADIQAHPAWRAHRHAIDALCEPAACLMATIEISVQKDATPPMGAIKSLEFVNRRHDFPLAAFRRYWREVHGPLACHIPQIIRYEQHHLPHPDAAARFDGWATTWFHSTAEMRAAAATPEYQRTRADEANFLAGPLPVVFMRERLLLLPG